MLKLMDKKKQKKWAKKIPLPGPVSISSLRFNTVLQIRRGSYMSAHVFIEIIMYVVGNFILFFCNDKFNKTGREHSGRVLDSRNRGRGPSLTDVTALWSLSKTHLS